MNKKRKHNKSKKTYENMEEIALKKEEYPKAAIFTEGEVLDEKIIKKFDIKDILEKKNISIASDEEAINNDNRISSRVVFSEEEEEGFSVRKTFSVRESTAKMLNELKFLHPNVNIRLNVLIDNAIRYYHRHIIERGGFK